jgi:hypothetical protein
MELYAVSQLWNYLLLLNYGINYLLFLNSGIICCFSILELSTFSQLWNYLLFLNCGIICCVATVELSAVSQL